MWVTGYLRIGSLECQNLCIQCDTSNCCQGHFFDPDNVSTVFISNLYYVFEAEFLIHIEQTARFV